MKTQFNTGNLALDRELNSILEERTQRPLTVNQVSTKEGKRALEIASALIIPVIVFTIILVLNHFNLIREF